MVREVGIVGIKKVVKPFSHPRAADHVVLTELTQQVKVCPVLASKLTVGEHDASITAPHSGCLVGIDKSVDHLADSRQQGADTFGLVQHCADLQGFGLRVWGLGFTEA